MSKLAALVLGVVLLSACTTEVASEDEGLETEVSSDLSAFADTVVSLRRDTRRCAAPLCGGYFVRDVNRTGAEVYVRDLDFTRARFDAQTRDDVIGAPDGDVLLRGRLGPIDVRSNTRALLALEAWRAMPGSTARSGDVLYRVDRSLCQLPTCRRWRATRLNVGTFGDFYELLGGTMPSPMVDAAWAINEAYTRNALVLGTVRYARVAYPVLDASRIFLKLPQRADCAAPSVPRCPSGTVRTFERGLDRCLRPGACVRPDNCEPERVVCTDGYVPRTWVGAAGCTRGVCEPAFVR
jgi:hypothetical protein